MTALAILRNQNGNSGTYEVKATLSYCGQVLEQKQSVQVPSYERVKVSLMTINAPLLEVGDYLLNVTLEQNGISWIRCFIR